MASEVPKISLIVWDQQDSKEARKHCSGSMAFINIRIPIYEGWIANLVVEVSRGVLRIVSDISRIFEVSVHEQVGCNQPPKKKNSIRRFQCLANAV